MNRKLSFTRRDALAFGGLLTVPMLLEQKALAQTDDYPNRDIRVICAFPAGSGADVLCRFYAEGMKSHFSKPIFIENKVGASGNLATNFVARAAPDGYTLYIHGANSVAANMSLFKDPGVDAGKTIECLATVSKLAFTVCVPKDSPFKTFNDLIEAVRKKGAKASYATTAPTGQVAGAMIKEILGLPIVEIPYRTGADSLNDLASGNIDYAMYDPTFALAQEAAGRIRLLAITSKERMKVMPSVPTLHELGVKDVDCVGWWALMAPRGIPDPIKQKLRAAFLDMARSNKTEEFLVKAGTDPFVLDGDEAQEFFLKEIENWRQYVKIAKMEAKG